MNNFKASSVIEHFLRQGVLQPRGAGPVVESQVVLLFLLIVSVCVYAVNSPLTAKKKTPKSSVKLSVTSVNTLIYCQFTKLLQFKS